MKNLKSFKLYEGDWWDNDSNAPWNRPDDPDPIAGREYSEAQRDFVVLGIPGDDALLKKKSDGSLWVLDTTDIADDYDDYLYYYPQRDDDESERAEGFEDEEYASIATTAHRHNSIPLQNPEGKGAWDERDGTVRLFKIDLELAEELIEDYVNYSRRRDRRYALSTSKMDEYKRAASILSKAFPEA